MYTFTLKVTDSANQSSTAEVHVFVKPPTNQPPIADAGENITISLPQTWVVLSAANSTDDNKIEGYRWEEVEGPSIGNILMANESKTNVTGLTKGGYVFKVTVTDDNQNAATDLVYVIVNQSKNFHVFFEFISCLYFVRLVGRQPIIQLCMRSCSIILWIKSGTASLLSLEVQGVADRWRSVLLALKFKFCSVLIAFLCIFVYITLINCLFADKNQKPTANAGGNFEIDLPRNVITLNGSKSSDDWAITKWKWTRHDSSLAVGNIAENSDETPTLILTDCSVGKYVFNLTVYDEQGLSDTDTVTFIVNDDPQLYYLVEITIDADVKHLTESQYNTLKGKLALLVKDGTRLQVRGVKPELGTERAIISFYVETADGKPQPATEVVQYLRQKLRVDASILGFSVSQLQTTICQNTCSGHGVCNEQTRECMCEAFWMKVRTKNNDEMKNKHVYCFSRICSTCTLETETRIAVGVSCTSYWVSCAVCCCWWLPCGA